MNAGRYDTDVCIVGGGPAGMTLGLLLARHGARVLVLERHPDFKREYRGEVLMPRFSQALRQIDLFDFVEGYPHTKLRTFEMFQGERRLVRVAFGELCAEFPFAIWMPQPILLGALYDRAKELEGFDMWFGATAHDLIRDGDSTAGVVVRRDDRGVEVRARVVVGADGRGSRIRRLGSFEIDYEEHTFDVLWFSLPRPAEYKSTFRFFLGLEHSYLVAPKHPDLVQCGLLMPRDGFRGYKDAGVEAIRRDLLAGPRVLHGFARQLEDLTPFFPLKAEIRLVREWAKDGLLLVGDAAHTCSPVGAIGVAVAVETAIVAADVILQGLADGEVSARRLSRVQSLREAELRQVQGIQRRLGGPVLSRSRWLRRAFPLLLPLAARVGLIQRNQRRLVVASGPLPVRSELRL